MTIVDHEVANDHLEVEQGTSGVDHKVADDESQNTTVWIWRPDRVLTSWICCLSLGLSDGGDPVRQSQMVLETSSDFMTILGTAKPSDLGSEKPLV